MEGSEPRARRTIVALNICVCDNRFSAGNCLSSAACENLGDHDNRLDKTEKQKFARA
jgi:hypothetical protein